LLAFLQDFVNFKSFLRKGERIGKKKGADVNEGKFVLNIDFIIDLKPEGIFSIKWIAFIFNVIWFIQKPKAMQSQDKALQSANKTSFWHCIFSLNHL
jgi:hypothetical protein